MSFTANIDDVVAENRNRLLGKRPEWKRVRLKEVATILNGYPFESARFKRNAGTPLIRIRDIVPGKTETFYDGDFDPAFLVERGDLLIGMDGDFHCQPWTGERALLNQRVCKIVPDESRYTKQFLRYVLPGYLNAVNEHTPSVTVKHLSSRTIANIPLPLPQIDEQRRIVAEIEKQFTRLEAGVAALLRVQVNLKRYRAAVLKAACEGRLVPTEAELAKAENRKFETGEVLIARIVNERRQNWRGRGKYKEPAKPDASRHGSLPDGWTWASVEQLLREPLCNGVSVKGSDNPPGVRALRLSAMSNSGFDYSNARYLPLDDSDVDDLWIQEGDFFMSRGNGSLHLVGRGTSAQKPPEPTIFPDTMIRLRLTDAVRRSGWLRTLWPSRIIRGQIETRVKTTAGIYKIAQPQVEGMVIPLPPLAEQTRIVAEVGRQLSLIQELETIMSTDLHRAIRLRQSILQSAFTGDFFNNENSNRHKRQSN